jgi:hypothetical protein
MQLRCQLQNGGGARRLRVGAALCKVITPILHRVVLQTRSRVPKLLQIDWPAVCKSHHAPPALQIGRLRE